MLSRPVSSGWKPVLILHVRSGQASSRLETRPLVGWVMVIYDGGEDFEQGAFARAVAADDADNFPAVDFEGNIFQRPQNIFGVLRFKL